MSKYRCGLVAAAFVLTALVAAGSASADLVTPRSLQGEQFIGDTLVTDNCGADRTFTFTVHGVATGPYTGEFTETGSVTAGPAPLAGTGPTTLVSFEAEFTITTTDGTIVTGHKQAVASVANSAICDRVLLGFDRGAIAQVTYTATIGNEFSDSGTGAVTTEDSFSGNLSPVLGGGGDFQTFEESFDLSNGVVPVAPEGKVTGGGWIMQGLDRVSFGFEAQALPKSRLHGSCSVIDHVTKAHVRCLTVDELTVVGTHASFTGQALVNGVTTSYRIDVDDVAEPGRLVDRFAIVTGTGFAAAGQLLGGNIQIHTS
jgi:hypothetical protein